MKKLKELRKSKKGFTLVEIIVVLIIIAILAAATIPTMLGFVDDAKGKALVANARAGYIGAQMIATEGKAAGKTDAAVKLEIQTAANGLSTRMVKLLGDDVVVGNILIDATMETNTGKITKFVYVDKALPDTDGTRIIITPGASTVVEVGTTITTTP